MASDGDVKAITAIDQVAQYDTQRRHFIERAVVNAGCWVAVTDGQILGYSVFGYTFYDHGFVSMVYVAEGHRRLGVGEALLRRTESECRTPRLFTSTNLSNLPMQALLNKLGYALSGIVHNLDEGDPEVVYFKSIKVQE
jgi:ribosomal protein S18 acetylase RimI-like enzyme